MFLGVDTGGTFTDFVLFDGRCVKVHKVLSTPDAPERAILQGVTELGVDTCDLRVIHGSTVATNAALEGKGVRTVFITNRGFADLLTIGRQARDKLYELQPDPVEPPVPRELCLETGGRLAADGTVLEELSEADLAMIRQALERLAPRSVAINLLYSYLDDGFERRIESVVPPGIFVSRSSQVLPEYREYERGIATWLNAWVSPLVQGYLQRLVAGLKPARVSVMQSSGETIEAHQAGAQAVHMLLSGPAGGLAGAGFVGRLAGEERLLSFDMGGTSTDVALIEGRPSLTSEGRIGRYPVGVPMVDMHTIGAGGGSIAWMDEGGLLRVGPQSAGATPGPACYARGGVEPTVTDANLVLGRLRSDAFLGGAMTLDEVAARQALGRLGETLGLGVEQAAQGVVRVANEHMAAALRVISVQRGIDPRDRALACFGGAGGLHVCALAEALGMSRALVPIHAGVLSALGMLVAPPGRQLSRTLNGLVDATPADRVEDAYLDLTEQGRSSLTREGVALERMRVERSLDLRYQGQSYTLSLPWQGLAAAAPAFHEAHERRYGHRLEVPVELVNLRVAVHGPIPELHLAKPAGSGDQETPDGGSRVHGLEGQVPVCSRPDLGPGRVLKGPVLITETVSTTYVAPRWSCRVDPHGNLMLTRT